jgi:hypothetical protein
MCANQSKAIENQWPGLPLNPISQVDNGNGTVMRQPFPGNIIPASLISPAARNLFADPSIYPLPQTAANTNNWNAAATERVNEDLGDLKIDYVLSSKDNLSGRFSADNRSGRPLISQLCGIQ